MSIFTQGKASATQEKTFSPAEVASRLFAIKLLLSRLEQSGVAPQTFGEYINSGPRRFSPGTISVASSGLMSVLNQPGAFAGSGTRQTGRPQSPSQFQDIAGSLITLKLLNDLVAGHGGVTGSLGSIPGLGPLLKSIPGIGSIFGSPAGRTLGTSEIPSIGAADLSPGLTDFGLPDIFQAVDPAAGGSYGVLQSDAGPDFSFGY